MTKEAVQEYLQEVNSKLYPDSFSMQEYCRKNCSDVFKSKSGYYVKFEKPTIKTQFCFGHGYCGITTEEETDRAFSMAEKARKDAEYFINENLEDLNEQLKLFESDEKLFLTNYYPNNKVKIASIKSARYFGMYSFDEKYIVAELDKEEIEQLKAIVNSEIEKFTKRLNTYLKRYGLSKIHSWTYLVD